MSARKIHTGNIPRLGGVGIFAGFIITFLFAMLLPIGALPRLQLSGRFWPVAVAGSLVFLTGLIDDFYNLRARFKFLIELALATLLVLMGYRFRTVSFPFFGLMYLDLGIFSYPLTVLWIVGVTNALNMIDGMDGLAGTISVMVAGIFATFFYFTNDYPSAIICIIIAGAVGGFLVFNKPKASIFMGDSGALFLGFLLAVLPLLNHSVGGAHEMGFLSAITALLIPIYDAFAAILRRMRAHVPFFSPDRGHLHHKLLDLGLTPWQVLGIIVAASLILGVGSLSILYLLPRQAFCFKISIWALFLGLFLVLHYNKERRLRASESTAK